MLPVLFIRTRVNTSKIHELYMVTGSHIKRQSVISLNHLASKGVLSFSRVIIEKLVYRKHQAEYYIFDFTGRAFMVRIEEHHYDLSIENALYWIGQVDVLKMPPHTGLRKSYAIKAERILSAHLTPDEKAISDKLTHEILHEYPNWLRSFTTDSLFPSCRDRYLG